MSPTPHHRWPGRRLVDRELPDALDELQRDPCPHYERARRAEGLTYVAELDAWLVDRDADVREVLRRPEQFSSANALVPVLPAPAVLGGGFGGGPVVVTADGAHHQQLRAPIVRGPSPARVTGVLPGRMVRGRCELLVVARSAPWCFPEGAREFFLVTS